VAPEFVSVRRLGDVLARSLILALALSFALGPAEIDYGTNVMAARLSRGEPSLVRALLGTLDDYLCPRCRGDSPDRGQDATHRT
jgi:hypothetical protein